MSAIDPRNSNFTTPIRQVAATIGRAPTPEQIEIIDEVTRSLAFAEAGQLLIESDGKSLTLPQYWESELSRPTIASLPSPSTPARSSASPVGQGWLPAEGFSGMARNWAQRHQEKVAAEAATWANPWVKGPNYNRTRQQVIQNVNPAQAAEMRIKAGVA